MSRIQELNKKIEGQLDPDSLMMSILEVFTESVLIPEVGGYYTFVYYPKTSNFEYDAHPLVAVTSIEKWGFRAINFHWGMSRQYTWIEVIGKLHIVYPEEISYLRKIPFAKFSHK